MRCFGVYPGFLLLLCGSTEAASETGRRSVRGCRLSGSCYGLGTAGGLYANFDRHDSYKALSAGKEEGVFVRELSGGAGEVRFVSSGGAPHTAWDGSGFYNGGRYHRGSLTSPIHEPATRFDTLIPSWNAATPASTWVQLEIRVRSGGAWTRWFNMGVWASGTESLKRHSVSGQEGEGWEVLTDTLQSRGPVCADSYQYRLTLFTEMWGVSPRAWGVFVVASDSHRHGECLGLAADEGSWGRELAVPARSQMVYEEGGEAWCSPASLSMVLAYWAGKTGNASLDQPVPAAAQGTYDHVYEGNGNWPFNAAYASSFGLKASVIRFGLGQVERWVAYGVPVVASVAWGAGELAGAPIPASEGHLLVIRGFDALGDVITNDPAGRDDSQVRRVYHRDEFVRAWANGSGGVAYLVYPDGWGVPDGAHGSW